MEAWLLQLVISLRPAHLFTEPPLQDFIAPFRGRGGGGRWVAQIDSRLGEGRVAIGQFKRFTLLLNLQMIAALDCSGRQKVVDVLAIDISSTVRPSKDGIANDRCNQGGPRGNGVKCS